MTSTNPREYKKSVEKIAKLPIDKVFPAHHSLDIMPSIIMEIKQAFQEIEEDDKLKHGSGIFNYSNFQIHL